MAGEEVQNLKNDKTIEKLEFDKVTKMIDITIWMQSFLETLNETFKNRVWFVGLQGSYGRGEATETSDIDVVVILDELSAADNSSKITTTSISLVTVASPRP